MKKPTPGKNIRRKSGFFTFTEPENQAEIKAYEKWKKKQGYVYIGADTNKEGLYKIGSSRKLNTREKTLRVGNPHFKIMYFVRSMDCLKLEREIQNKYEGMKISGEWFSLSNNDMVSIFSEYRFEVYKS